MKIQISSLQFEHTIFEGVSAPFMLEYFIKKSEHVTLPTFYYGIYSNFPYDDSNIGWFRFIVFKATFNNISVISWRSVLLVEETAENHRPVAIQ